ncbi:MAG: ribosome silencing factor [Cyanobacteria bacterium P01_D01_bin.73]
MVESQSNSSDISVKELSPEAASEQEAPQSVQSEPSPIDPRTEAIAYAIADAMDDRKGEDIVLLKLADVSYIADFFVIGTAFSRAQVRAMSQSVRDRVKNEFGLQPNNVSGEGDSAWVLQDYGDIIVHILMPDERTFYNLEAFWGHGESIPFEPSMVTAVSSTAATDANLSALPVSDPDPSSPDPSGPA